jgi:ribosome-associated translation inhibitor RaiA
VVLPIQITFRNMDHSDRIEKKIQKEAAKLDRFYDRIISCRVMVEAPERHHQRGNAHHVRIDLGLPGEELVVKSEPSLHSSLQQTGEQRVSKRQQLQVPHKEAELAVRDAFRSARRRLQDFVQQRRGEVKTRAARAMKVSRLVPQNGVLS